MSVARLTANMVRDTPAIVETVCPVLTASTMGAAGRNSGSESKIPPPIASPRGTPTLTEIARLCPNCLTVCGTVCLSVPPTQLPN